MDGTKRKPSIETLSLVSSPTEQRLLVALWDGKPLTYVDVQKKAKLVKVKPGTFDKYLRRLNQTLLAKTGGGMWIDFGSTVLHGKWCRLSRTG